jgi:hypothetical protein
MSESKWKIPTLSMTTVVLITAVLGLLAVVVAAFSGLGRRAEPESERVKLVAHFRKLDELVAKGAQVATKICGFHAEVWRAELAAGRDPEAALALSVAESQETISLFRLTRMGIVATNTDLTEAPAEYGAARREMLAACEAYFALIETAEQPTGTLADYEQRVARHAEEVRVRLAAVWRRLP